MWKGEIEPREPDTTYNEDMDGAVSQEIVVQPRQIGASAGDELEGCVDDEYERTLALDGLENFLLLLLDLVAQSIEVLDDVGRSNAGGGSGDVVQRGVGGEEGRVGRRKELLVGRGGRHDGPTSAELLTSGSRGVRPRLRKKSRLRGVDAKSRGRDLSLELEVSRGSTEATKSSGSCRKNKMEEERQTRHVRVALPNVEEKRPGRGRVEAEKAN